MLAEPEPYFLTVLRNAGIDCGDLQPDDLFDRASFVRVLKVSGAAIWTGDRAEVATIDFDCFAQGTKTDAHELCQKALGAILASVGQVHDGVSIGWPTITGVYSERLDNMPSEVYRQYATMDVLVRTHI